MKKWNVKTNAEGKAFATIMKPFHFTGNEVRQLICEMVSKGEKVTIQGVLEAVRTEVENKPQPFLDAFLLDFDQKTQAVADYHMTALFPEFADAEATVAAASWTPPAEETPAEEATEDASPEDAPKKRGRKAKADNATEAAE